MGVKASLPESPDSVNDYDRRRARGDRPVLRDPSGNYIHRVGATVPSTAHMTAEEKARYRAFPGSAILEKTFCGSIDTTDPAEYQDLNMASRLMKRADLMCVSSPIHTDDDGISTLLDYSQHKRRNSAGHATSAMLARALVSEVTDNPNTMTPAEMTAREKYLLKAQMSASRAISSSPNSDSGTPDRDYMGAAATRKPVGSAGVGVGPPNVLNSIAYACTGDESVAMLGHGNSDDGSESRMVNFCTHPLEAAGIHTGNTSPANEAALLAAAADDLLLVHSPATAAALAQRSRNMVAVPGSGNAATTTSANGHIPARHNPHRVTLALCLSRASLENHGHPDTVTRQTAFDFNLLQDRAYKYVSATDANGWLSGGGEDGSPHPLTGERKKPSPDHSHVPIITIDCPNEAAVDSVIHALASGEIFIPHMEIVPEAVTVNQATPPDLLVKFGCERLQSSTHNQHHDLYDDDTVPPDEWSNWCLEFMHNQLYEYFYSAGAIWSPRPFCLTLAKNVRWKTVKHMNHYFANADSVVTKWRNDHGSQYLNPMLGTCDGVGASPDEVAHPHGIYLLRHDGVPTNYFAPNFDPPYTTKMTRSLLSNVLNKSWDTRRREWTSQPIPRLLTPGMLVAVACGCTTADANESGFVAQEVTRHHASRRLQQQESAPPQQRSSNSTRRSRQSPEVQSKHEKQTVSPPRAPFEEKKLEDPEEYTRMSPASHGQSPGRAFSPTKEASIDRFSPLDSYSGYGGGIAFERNASETMSKTTVVHQNTSKDKILLNAANRLYSDEDWHPTEVVSPIRVNHVVSSPVSQPTHQSREETSADPPAASLNVGTADPPGNKVTSPNWIKRRQKRLEHRKEEKILSPTSTASTSTTTDGGDDEYHEQPHRNPGKSAGPLVVEVTKAQIDNTVKPAQSPMDQSKPNFTNMGNRGLSNYAMIPLCPSPRKSVRPSVESSGSLDYSTDGSSLFFTQNGASTPVSGSKTTNLHFSSKRSPTAAAVARVDEDEERSALSIQESTSTSMSVVPTDEELFAVGWAKALDARSGNFYYFTLDRSQTVWENPLSAARSTMGDTVSTALSPRSEPRRIIPVD
jgi:hypothetical protein